MKQTTKAPSDGIYAAIARLSLPIVLQNLLSAAVSAADVVMLNFVGQSHISSVALAAQYASVLSCVFYGLGTGATILCAQYYGKGDLRAVRTVEGIALRFSIAASVLFAAGALFFPEGMMRVFTHDPELIGIGASYLRYMSVAYLCWGIVEVHLSVLRSVGRVTTSMIINLVALLGNIVLNAVFIFGLFGAPKMGAPGVALATSIARGAELLLALYVSYRSSDVKIPFRAVFERNRLLFQDFLRMALPALGNDIVWGLAFSMYSVIIGQYLGNDMVAANSFVTQVRTFGTAFCFGIANAAGILLGQIIGEGDMERAEAAAKKSVRATVLFGAVGGIIVLIAMPFVLRFADLTPTGLGYLRGMLWINVYYIMGQAVNTTLIVGIFRAGGDSRFGFYCDIVDMWLYAVPLGFLSAAVLKLPPMVVYFLLCTDEFAKWPAVICHYRKKKWLKNITRDNVFEG